VKFRYHFALRGLRIFSPVAAPSNITHSYDRHYSILTFAYSFRLLYQHQHLAAIVFPGCTCSINCLSGVGCALRPAYSHERQRGAAGALHPAAVVTRLLEPSTVAEPSPPRTHARLSTTSAASAASAASALRRRHELLDQHISAGRPTARPGCRHAGRRGLDKRSCGRASGAFEQSPPRHEHFRCRGCSHGP
jgi:hypothetical protein